MPVRTQEMQLGHYCKLISTRALLYSRRMPNEIPDKLIMGCTHSFAEVNVHPEGPPPPKKFMFTIEAP